MPNQPKLAHHEALELHELINTYLIGTKKLNAGLSMVQDEELKNFMQDSLNNKNTKLQEIEEFFYSGDQQQQQTQDDQQWQN